MISQLFVAWGEVGQVRGNTRNSRHQLRYKSVKKAIDTSSVFNATRNSHRKYSQVPNKRGGQNKRRGGNFLKILINGGVKINGGWEFYKKFDKHF